MSQICRLWLEGPSGRLEARLRSTAHPRASAVVAHPHPLHGGTLHNPVVFHADRELNRAEFLTLRFNFRGVGSSEGAHDAGRGEVDDLASAVCWLRTLRPDLPLVVVGYSFGAWCAIRYAARDRRVAAVVAIGLPIRLYPFEEIGQLGRPIAVVQAEHDEFGAPKELQPLLGAVRPRGVLHVVGDADHRLGGRAAETAAYVVGAACRALGSSAA